MNGNLFEPAAPETASDWLTAHCDGGSRGNPGPSGYGAVIEDSRGRTVAELSEFLGIQTNNYAEYSGLLAVLRWAIENNAPRLRVVSDSELMVKQMQGKYAVKSPVLLPLFQEAKKLARRIDAFEMRHTLRGGNKVADRLANEAMDKGMGRTPASGAGGVSGVAGVSNAAARPYGRLETTPAPRPTPIQPAKPAAPGPSPLGTRDTKKPARQVLEGYVKGGVVHLLEGELPDGIFVKVTWE